MTENIDDLLTLHCLLKGILSQQRMRHSDLKKHIFHLSGRHRLIFNQLANSSNSLFALQNEPKSDTR